AGMYALMRSWGVSRAGSGLSALGYGFGAPILFQYCNIIFLVGAAWTPLALRAIDRWLRLGRRLALVELAAVLALQTLGGDPQVSCVSGVCAGGYALILARRRLGTGRVRHPVVRGLGFLCLAGLWVLATLAAARWLPALRPPARHSGEPPPAFPWTPFVS